MTAACVVSEHDLNLQTARAFSPAPLLKIEPPGLQRALRMSRTPVDLLPTESCVTCPLAGAPSTRRLSAMPLLARKEDSEWWQGLRGHRRRDRSRRPRHPVRPVRQNLHIDDVPAVHTAPHLCAYRTI